ncbi:hypothetical protein [Paenibacillus ginsengarvi]|uniref:Photosynthesis system II assembly factor Ycf48/Hcf136-like domain-containing protein n=1 Tax=Paenibacillus ginsengarvi TaxID=400777 RepID=A0A3B0CKJ7_9BACL|nr:hypothetical protein [Paenibacillus ginsengarvi]RKN85742.1 hypothetical protein D7M11_05210 [Paenibacillus ginsengarvi]
MRRAQTKIWTIAALMLGLLLSGCGQADGTQGSVPPAPEGGTSAVNPGGAGGSKPTEPPKTPDRTEGTGEQLAAVRMDRVTAVRLADAKSGWLGGDGWIAHTDDGGQTWSPQYSGKGTVRQLFALNGREAWAVIEEGTGDSVKSRKLLATKDGGKTWTAAGTVPNGGFLHFISQETAFSANAKTTDGGKTWTTLAIPEHTKGDAYFHDAGNGWAVTQQGDTITVKRTADGGKSWQDVLSKPIVAAVTDAVIRSAGANDAWVELVGESGMTQTSYALFHTKDGGKEWQTVIANSTAGGGPAPGFPMGHTGGPKNGGSKPGALYVVSPDVAFMGGQCPACDKPNTIGWTTDGGRTWVTGETALPGYGPQLLAIADAKSGWWINTDNSEPAVMYTTADGGQSWHKVHTFEKPKPAL